MKPDARVILAFVLFGLLGCETEYPDRYEPTASDAEMQYMELAETDEHIVLFVDGKEGLSIPNARIVTDWVDEGDGVSDPHIVAKKHRNTPTMTLSLNPTYRERERLRNDELDRQGFARMEIMRGEFKFADGPFHLVWDGAENLLSVMLSDIVCRTVHVKEIVVNQEIPEKRLTLRSSGSARSTFYGQDVLSEPLMFGTIIAGRPPSIDLSIFPENEVDNPVTQAAENCKLKIVVDDTTFKALVYTLYNDASYITLK